MASGPITSWQIDGEKVETVTDFIFRLTFKVIIGMYDPITIFLIVLGLFYFT